MKRIIQICKKVLKKVKKLALNFLLFIYNGFYKLSLLIYYRPQKKWEKDYVNDLFAFGSSKEIWKILKQRFLSFFGEQKDLIKNGYSKKKLLLDFYFCYKLYGAEEEDYFGFKFYKIKHNTIKNYVTRQKLNFLKKYLNTDNVNLVRNKSEFADYFKEFFNRNFVNFPSCSKEVFIETFKNCNKLIVKPENLNSGKGIFLLDNNADKIEENYNVIRSKNAKMIVEEYVNQKGFLNDINPSSLNTLRVITIRRGDIIKAVACSFRAGGKDSVVDNFHSGGIKYSVNINTGILSKGFSMKSDKSFSRHPSTGIRVEGKKIPRYDEAISLCIKAHKKAPHGLDYLGWDVCVSTDKILIIEANDGAGFPKNIDKNDNVWLRVKEMLNIKVA